jgi:IS5 family transposase
MMGTASRPEPKLFYTHVNLDERIGPGHFLRQVDKLIDFSFIRDRVAHLYGPCGNESIDPAVVLKLMFILFYENVASERRLMEQMPCRLDWLWFCGYDLESVIPDHSIISKARRRWGQEVFNGFFAKVLEQCLQADLVGGDTGHIDSSLIEGSADRQRLGPALRVRGQQLYAKLEQTATAPATEPGAAPDQAATLVAQVPAQESAVQAGPQEPALPTVPVCPSDPDARLTKKYGQSVLGYKDHRVVDDRCGIITATVTTNAAVDDGSMLGTLLTEHQFNVGQPATQVAADKAYGTAENYRELQERQVRPCIPHSAHRDQPGQFPRRDFQYDEQRDGFTCPAGQFLGRWSREETRQRTRYRAAKGVCAACPLKAQCSAGKGGRLMSRYDLQEYIEWADACGPANWRRGMMRRRKIRAEGSFADAANNHGYKRARWRGLWKMTVQNLMVATVQNIRKLVHAARRGTNRAGKAVILGILTTLRAALAARTPRPAPWDAAEPQR